jgi:hypothetical protein
MNIIRKGLAQTLSSGRSVWNNGKCSMFLFDLAGPPTPNP